jgi:hypothetical protein
MRPIRFLLCLALLLSTLPILPSVTSDAAPNPPAASASDLDSLRAAVRDELNLPSDPPLRPAEQAASPWVQTQRFDLDTGAVNSAFGFPVVIDGDTALVTAYNRDSLPSSSGAMGAQYVFVRQGTSWVKQARLTDLIAELYTNTFAKGKKG